MDTILKMFTLGLQFMIHGVILSICHDHLFLCIYVSCLSVFVKPRYTEIQSFRRDRVNIHTECSYTPFFLLVVVLTTKRNIQHKKETFGIHSLYLTLQHIGTEKCKIHMKTEEVTLEPAPPLKRIYN